MASAEARGKQIPTRALPLLSVWVGVALDEKPARLGQKQLQLGAEGTENSLWSVLEGTDPGGIRQACVPWQGCTQRGIDHALSETTEWGHLREPFSLC